jgi:S1-C subfamily serine protease
MKKKVMILVGVATAAVLGMVAFFGYQAAFRPRLLSGPVAIVTKQNLHRGYLGLSYEAVPSQQADFFGTDRGVVVTEIVAGSTAQESVLQPQDVIVAIDGRPLAAPEAMRSLTLTWKPNQKIHLRPKRKAAENLEEVELQVRLMTFDELNKLLNFGP